MRLKQPLHERITRSNASSPPIGMEGKLERLKWAVFRFCRLLGLAGLIGEHLRPTRAISFCGDPTGLTPSAGLNLSYLRPLQTISFRELFHEISVIIWKSLPCEGRAACPRSVDSSSSGFRLSVNEGFYEFYGFYVFFSGVCQGTCDGAHQRVRPAVSSGFWRRGDDSWGTSLVGRRCLFGETKSASCRLMTVVALLVLGWMVLICLGEPSHHHAVRSFAIARQERARVDEEARERMRSAFGRGSRARAFGADDDPGQRRLDPQVRGGYYAHPCSGLARVRGAGTWCSRTSRVLRTSGEGST